ncbi:MAG: insulinase family protein [Acidobacteriia bacterium]|nr:insulinase family protein [Terriglobia bacterium]
MRTRTITIVVALLAILVVSGVALAKQPPVMPKGLPAFGADKPLPAPSVVTETLPNGLTVWIVSRPGFPKVDASLVVSGGNAGEPGNLPGLADVLASALKEGTATRSSKQIAEQMQGVGGTVDASASPDAYFINADALTNGAGTLIEIVGDVAQHPSFPKDEVELVKQNTLQELMAQRSTPEYAVNKKFFETVYGDHPYRVVGPTEESVAKVTPELLQSEHARLFRPDRALLVIAGAVDPETVRPPIRKAFGGWSTAGRAPAATPPSPAARDARTIVVVDRPGSVQSEIRVGRPTVKVTNGDFYPMVVANTIFGGSFASRLTENIREDKGYTYSPDSSNRAREQGGLLRVRAAVHTEVTAGTLLEIFYELDRMGATQPTDEELGRAKRYLNGLYLLTNSLNGAVVNTLATNWVNGLPPSALAEFVPKVNAVTAEQVQDVGKRYMSSLTQTVVIGGDAAKVVPAVAQFGVASVAKP